MICAVVGALSGCAWDEETIDEQVGRLVADESAAVGRETTAPERRVRPSETPASAFDKRPGTVNPDIGALHFKSAPESRDSARTLELLEHESLGRPGPGNGPTGETPAHPDEAGPVPPLDMDLERAWSAANVSARELLNAEETYIVAAIGLLVERHRWSPRLSNDTTLAAAGTGTQGSFQHALDVINTLKATQRLPFGGQVEAAWVWHATEQLREQSTSRYVQSSSIVLSGTVPLLRGAGLIAQEDLIQSERNVVYESRRFERFRRQLLVSIASDYFQLVQSEAEIANQERQLESLRQLAESTKARVDAGRINPFEYNLTENEVLQAEASLAGLRERYILEVDRFKVRLGLDLDRPLTVLGFKLEVPVPDITLREAAEIALDLRLDLQNQRDQLDDARRAVRNAKNALLPDLNLAGNVSIPTNPQTREGGVGFQPEDLAYTASLTFGLPLDRKIEALALRQSVIALEQKTRDYERARDDVVVTVRAAVRAIELARFQLRLAEEGVDIATRRLEEQKLKEDLVEPQKIVDSQNALLQAENSRDRAKTDLRNAILNYLLESDQLRVSPSGQLLPLPGMRLPGPDEGNAPNQGAPPPP